MTIAPPTIIWNAVTRREDPHPGIVAARDRLADAARAGEWPRVLTLLDADDTMPGADHPAHVNAWRVGGTSWYAPLHQAAHHGAPSAVVNALLDRGAWRTLRAADGRRPVDIAAARGHTRMLDLLEPHPRRPVPDERLAAIESRLHDLMERHTQGLISRNALCPPQLSVLTERPPETRMYCGVPGMFGGFHLWFAPDDSLMADAATRMDWGQGPLFRVTPDAAERVDPS